MKNDPGLFCLRPAYQTHQTPAFQRGSRCVTLPGHAFTAVRSWPNGGQLQQKIHGKIFFFLKIIPFMTQMYLQFQELGIQILQAILYASRDSSLSALQPNIVFLSCSSCSSPLFIHVLEFYPLNSNGKWVTPEYSQNGLDQKQLQVVHLQCINLSLVAVYVSPLMVLAGPNQLTSTQTREPLSHWSFSQDVPPDQINGISSSGQHRYI